MKIRSLTTDRVYEQDEMVCIVNVVQIAKYLKANATLYDFFESNGALVAVFSKKETQVLYQKWVAHQL